MDYMILYTGKSRYQGMKAIGADLHISGKAVPIYLTLEIGNAIMDNYWKVSGKKLSSIEAS
jgi:hypothetical protein